MLILKKADLDSSESKSYHPISNLSVVSKLLERLVTQHLIECPPAKYDILPEVQSFVSFDWGQHAFVCKRASGRTQRHQALNDVIARSFASAGIPVSKELTGIYRDSVKWPDGVTLVPWQ